MASVTTSSDVSDTGRPIIDFRDRAVGGFSKRLTTTIPIVGNPSNQGSLTRQRSRRPQARYQLDPVLVQGPNDFDSGFKAVHSADGVAVLESSRPQGARPHHPGTLLATADEVIP